MPLPGWTKLGGSAQRYRTPEGREVSRRQYENVRAQQAGWKNWSQYQRTRRKDDNYLKWWGRAKGAGTVPMNQKASPVSEFSKKYLAVQKARAGNDPDLYDPDGPLADLLIYTGDREPDWEWDVGDTPGGDGD